MPLLTDAELMPDWVAAGLASPPWEPPDTVVPELPAWLRDAPLSSQEPRCECARCAGAETPSAASEVPEEAVRWAVPGVWPATAAPVAVGALVGQLDEVLSRLALVAPATVPEGRALAETEALLSAQHRLRVLTMGRVDDARGRELYERSGYRGFTPWYRTVAPDAPLGDPALARKLGDWPAVARALDGGSLSLVAATKLASALATMRRYLDPPDGLIDGRPAEDTVTAVVGNVVDLVCADHCGLQPDAVVDPVRAAQLVELESAVARIQTDGGSQRDRVEQAVVLLAEHIHPSRLDGPLEQLLLGLVPERLEERDREAAAKRELSVVPQRDGTWRLRATLDAETGELLHAALSAEARRDPCNPVDTAARAAARAAAAEERGLDGWADAAPAEPYERTPDASLPDGGVLVPRSPSVRLHDAFRRLLSRYLGSGLGGVHGKVPVQLSAIVNQRAIDGLPGAPPPIGGSGRPLARSLIRRWWCDAHVTTLLMSRGWTPLGIVHSARTITGTELKASRVQYDQRCPGLGCCSGTPDPLVPLVPHHLRRHAVTGTTSLMETVLVCENLHADIHLGNKAIRLRDGRLITEDGYLEEG